MSNNLNTKKLTSAIDKILSEWEADFRTAIDQGMADESTLEEYTCIQTIRNLGFLNVASASYLLRIAEEHLNDKTNLPELKSEAKKIRDFIRNDFDGSSGKAFRIYRLA